jgi:hypothetical protein
LEAFEKIILIKACSSCDMSLLEALRPCHGKTSRIQVAIEKPRRANH